MSWKFAVRTTLALFVIVIGMGAWISLNGLNRMLAQPVQAWDLERVGETHILIFLGENLPVDFPGRLAQTIAPLYGGMREKLQGVSEFRATRDFIRKAALAGQIAKKEAANCRLFITDFISRRYQAWTEL